MTRHRIGRWGLFALLFITAATSFGCSATGRSGVIQNTDVIDTSLHSGVSTKADVRTFLGEPNGYGGALLPTDPRPHEIWFYHLIGASATGTGKAVVFINLQMDMLLIFFIGEVYDGHMWFKNSSTGFASAY
jgi:hypothetical protein